MYLVDCRGLNCPEPVIQTKKALEEHASITTVVDNQVARDNVVKLVANHGYNVSVEQKERHYHIHITKGESEISFEEKLAPKGDYVILLTSSTFGSESPELGEILIKSYFYTLVEGDQKPAAILLANGGAKLSCVGSTVLDHLKALETKGVEILTCGTCLDYFQLKESLEVGTITNMYSISDRIAKASKVINL